MNPRTQYTAPCEYLSTQLFSYDQQERISSIFSLVLFDDSIYYICKEVDVIEQKYGTSIKYKDGKRYEGQIIARNDKWNTFY